MGPAQVFTSFRMPRAGPEPCGSTPTGWAVPDARQSSMPARTRAEKPNSPFLRGPRGIPASERFRRDAPERVRAPGCLPTEGPWRLPACRSVLWRLRGGVPFRNNQSNLCVPCCAANAYRPLLVYVTPRRLSRLVRLEGGRSPPWSTSWAWTSHRNRGCEVESTKRDMPDSRSRRRRRRWTSH
jgi:hypothetical protein